MKGSLNKMTLFMAMSLSSVYSFGQWTPAPGAENVNSQPVFIHNGVYIGNGGGSAAVYNLAVGSGQTSIVTPTPLPLQNNISSRFNTAVGISALAYYTGVSGSVYGFNTAVGTSAMLSLVTGSHNAALGNSAMAYYTSGAGNSAFGVSALQGAASPAPSGSYNSGFGFQALLGITSGSGNVAIGNNAMTALRAGSNNVAIGSGAEVASNTAGTAADNNQLSIQNVIYGSNMTNGANGRIRIGQAPAAAVAGVFPAGVIAKLRVNGTDAGYSTASIPSLQLDFVPLFGGSANPTPSPTGRYLFVDAAGVVAQAPLPPSSTGNANIYNTDGSLATVNTSTPRIVTMNDRNLWFNTTGSSTNGRIYIGSNNTPVMFPVASGNYRLYVEGGILTEKIKVAVRTTPNWADYVFADDYKLMPLQKVETFIKANKHLPGIEAAEDLIKNGLDLGNMQAKQMAKIEELTLYIIDQNKILEKQQGEIETLREQVKILLQKSK